MLYLATKKLLGERGRGQALPRADLRKVAKYLIIKDNVKTYWVTYHLCVKEQSDAERSGVGIGS
jgi:hypothetical protein